MASYALCNVADNHQHPCQTAWSRNYGVPQHIAQIIARNLDQQAMYLRVSTHSCKDKRHLAHSPAKRNCAQREQQQTMAIEQSN